ncbi:cytochrome P450 [Streptomyces sp. APSN-46.1]|uniref:cytochrome P450 n=1 Tax=Streptomyces sp. APSN-46.1 TaxID=2929049 RepID=UPI001FB50981|nr:cytochrome P450 [Streptomyces sp. APSN-46.1]MCJ1681151.1 cytochrome P450 [Streptomyces sp. APSN-46.1]
MRITVPGQDPEVDLEKIDLFDPGLYADGDPHPIWKVMRERAPVHHQVLPDGRAFWSVTRYEDACRVLDDHEYFTSERGTLLLALDVGDPAGGKMMAATDPPRHAAMRDPLARALSPKGLAARQQQLRAAVHGMLAPALTQDRWDLATAAAEFPMAFTGAIMGIPERDWPRLTRCTTMAVAPDDTEFMEGDAATTLMSVHHELFGYFADEIRERAGDPPDDLIGFLMTMNAGGEQLDVQELVYNCYSLLLGANVTTPHVLTAMMLALIEDPDSLRRMAETPSLLSSGVEEGLRWSSPANHFMRYAVRDVTLSGQHIPAGSAVAVWLGSANRDEAVFDDPYRFDIARSGNRHLAFGYGNHYCVGASLARITLRMIVREMLDLFESIELDGPVEHLRSNFVAGIKHMPIRTRLRPGAERMLVERQAPAGA